MTKGKGKTTSFDAMVKFFMQKYSIPTKKDVQRLMARLDRLENLIMHSSSGSQNVLKSSRQGVSCPEIQAQTGYGEKKIRNIIFRLHKSGKIKRKSRGIYIAA